MTSPDPRMQIRHLSRNAARLLLVWLTWPSTAMIADLPRMIALAGLSTAQYRRAYQELTRLGLIAYRDGSVQLALGLSEDEPEEEADG
jgi:hypothetical protein